MKKQDQTTKNVTKNVDKSKATELVFTISSKLHSTFATARKILYENVKNLEILVAIQRQELQFPLFVECCYRERKFNFYIANSQSLLTLNHYFDSVLDKEREYVYLTGKPPQTGESLSL